MKYPLAFSWKRPKTEFKYYIFCHFLESTIKFQHKKHRVSLSMFTRMQKLFRSIAQIFTKSEPNTVWNKIYNDHMSNDSFISSDIEATNVLLQKNELLTQYSEVDIMKRNSKPCEIQILWVSPTKARASIAFQKVS